MIQVIPYLGIGGAEVTVETLSTALVHRGYKVIIYSLYSTTTKITQRIDKDIVIKYFYKKKGIDLGLIIRLAKELSIDRPNVIHTHLSSLPYIYLARQFGCKSCKIIHTVHSVVDKEAGKFGRFIRQCLFKTAVTPVGISRTIKQSIQKKYGLNSAQVKLVYNGVSHNKFHPKYDYTINDHFKLLHIGRFSEEKNHMMMISVVKELVEKGMNVRLSLIGEGVLMDKCMEYVKLHNLDEKVIFLGLQEDVSEFLSNADVFLLPSLWEGMPISLIEAMITGLPIIAANVGGIPDMIKNQYSGILINCNPNELQNAIIELSEDESLRRKLGVNARTSAQRFNDKEMAASYDSIY